MSRFVNNSVLLEQSDHAVVSKLDFDGVVPFHLGDFLCTRSTTIAV